jgi:hypothetical protein
MRNEERRKMVFLTQLHTVTGKGFAPEYDDVGPAFLH